MAKKQTEQQEKATTPWERRQARKANRTMPKDNDVVGGYTWADLEGMTWGQLEAAQEDKPM